MKSQRERILTEEWKDIDGYEGRYQISNIGRVKSIAKKVNSPHGPNSRLIHEKILHVRRNPKIYEYQSILLRTLDRKRHTKNIHRLLADAFASYSLNK